MWSNIYGNDVKFSIATQIIQHSFGGFFQQQQKISVCDTDANVRSSNSLLYLEIDYTIKLY